MGKFSNCVGTALGNLLGAVLRSRLTGNQLASWGWRAAFSTGIVVVPVAAYLHFYGTEDGYERIEEEGENVNRGRAHPLAESLRRENIPILCSVFLTTMFGGLGYYITFIWMAVYMRSLIDPPVSGAFWINLLALVLYMSAGVGTGLLSDKYGRSKVMATGALSVGILAPLCVRIISRGQTFEACLAQLTIAFLISFFCGPWFAWFVERFPPQVRLTSVALGYNGGMVVAAGFSPALATALVSWYGPCAPGVL